MNQSVQPETLQARHDFHDKELVGVGHGTPKRNLTTFPIRMVVNWQQLGRSVILLVWNPSIYLGR